MITRPLGAAIPDGMGVSSTRGDLGMGTGPAVLVALVAGPACANAYGA